jgi:hypothetical protein
MTKAFDPTYLNLDSQYLYSLLLLVDSELITVSGYLTGKQFGGRGVIVHVYCVTTHEILEV